MTILIIALILAVECFVVRSYMVFFADILFLRIVEFAYFFLSLNDQGKTKANCQQTILHEKKTVPVGERFHSAIVVRAMLLNLFEDDCRRTAAAIADPGHANAAFLLTENVDERRHYPRAGSAKGVT